MAVNEKIKIIVRKIQRNKDQYNLDKQTTNIQLHHQEMLVNMNF